ncbi:MAG: prenyltransferase [Mediterranea massiliensis]|nr:prenyltransferase [Mediterranea massiliensis]
MKKHALKEWLFAVRPWSFPASAMPVVVTLAYLHWTQQEVNWLMGVWALLNIIVFHAAGNTWSDYYDYKRGVDREDTHGATTLTGGMFQPQEIKRLALGLLIVALAGGIALMWLTGLPLLYVGGAGLLLTVFYPWLKYHALGDADIFLTYSVLPMLGTSFVATGTFCYDTLWLTVPVGLITVGILHANNTRDMEHDGRARIKTFAMLMGKQASVYGYCFEVLFPFVWVLGCAVGGLFPWWVLLVLLALLPAGGNVRMMLRYPKQGIEAISGLDELTAKLQLMFGLLFALSFFVASWVR